MKVWAGGESGSFVPHLQTRINLDFEIPTDPLLGHKPVKDEVIAWKGRAFGAYRPIICRIIPDIDVVSLFRVLPPIDQVDVVGVVLEEH